MALLWMDSFGYLATADLSKKYVSVSGAMQIQSTIGRRSGPGVTPVSVGGIGMTTPLLAPNNTFITGIACKWIGGTGTFYTVLSSGSIQINMDVNGSGVVTVNRNGTLLGTASSPLIVNVYSFIELKVVVHPSAGSVLLRFNESPVLTLSGINTAATGVAAWNACSIGNIGGGSSVQCHYCDWHILDGSGSSPLNDLIGDCRVDARFPTGAGASTTWTPSTGSNWQNVDDAAPNDDTDYNSAATSPLTDTFVVQDAPIAGATFYGVQQSTVLKKSDAGSCTVAPIARIGSTDYAGTTINPGTSYVYATTMYGLSPATGISWTEAEFNAAQFGYKRLT